jgi:transposase InsO family protein
MNHQADRFRYGHEIPCDRRIGQGDRAAGGDLRLVAVMDWFSRYVWSWELSHTLDSGLCRTALEAALCWGQPEIFNTDEDFAGPGSVP